MLKQVNNWMLPLAMLTGAMLYRWSDYLNPITPGLIFLMIWLAFCRISPKEIRIHPAHVGLLLIQLLGCVAVYGVLLLPLGPIVAQGALVCVLAPTATAAAVITGMLGGNMAFITTYLLLCNLSVALAVPLLFPLIGQQHQEVSFLHSLTLICRQVLPLLLSPLLLAWLVRYYLPKVHRMVTGIHRLSFYLWAVALMIVTGNTVKNLVEQEHPGYQTEIALALVALFICVGQFLLGRRIGKRYGDPVSAGQGLGQKNTILAIWMAQSYLDPLSAIAPAAYVLWQNTINAYQLWMKRKKPETSGSPPLAS